MNTHKTTLHARCPLNGSWDYYELEVRTDDFIQVEAIETACDRVRGTEATQEFIAEELRESLPGHCLIQLHGRHGQNTQTTVEL